MHTFSLAGSRVLVTGGHSGIGFGIAQAVVACGAQPVLLARTEAALDAAVQRLADAGANAEAAVCDLARVDDLAPWYERWCQSHAPVTALVNAAGITRRGPAESLSLADWRAVQQVNVDAMFALCQAFARERIAAGQPGQIVNIASLMTSASRPGTVAYTTSKGAVGQLTKALAVDWAKHRLRVNAVAPGYVATPLTQPLQDDPDFDRWVRQRCPLGRWAEPADIAWPVAFLLSPAAGFITGEILYVDGGWMATF